MMDIEIKVNDKLNRVEILNEKGNMLDVLVNGKKYKIDIARVHKDIYSILYLNNSYNLEIIEGQDTKNFTVNSLYESFNVEIIDAESRYLSNRNISMGIDVGNTISSPMPGRIVKIPVKIGDKVEAGQTVIVVSAMKMESEYKSPKDSIIKEILVNEGDIINGHQTLITIE